MTQPWDASTPRGELCARHGVTEEQLQSGHPQAEMQAMLEEFVELAQKYLIEGAN